MIMINDASQNNAPAFHRMFIVKKMKKNEKIDKLLQNRMSSKILKRESFLKTIHSITYIHCRRVTNKRIFSIINKNWVSQPKLAKKFCLKLDLNRF